jgi:hypothetical protein
MFQPFKFVAFVPAPLFVLLAYEFPHIDWGCVAGCWQGGEGRSSGDVLGGKTLRSGRVAEMSLGCRSRRWLEGVRWRGSGLDYTFEVESGFF